MRSSLRSYVFGRYALGALESCGGLTPVFNPLRYCRRTIRFRAQARALQSLASSQSRRVVIGSARTRFPGWVATDRAVLDVLRDENWAHFFPANFLDAILAEHVWEHLTVEEAATAARICFRYLRPGGYVRVAVPDGCHPLPSYIESVRPGGGGEGAEDHKMLYSYTSLRDLFVDAGFEVHLMEYFDERGQFHFHDWNPSEGMIHRSKRFDSRNSSGDLRYTSIILDARKPATGAPGT